MKLFDKQYEILISVDADAPESVRLAACDLQRDLRRISGKENGFEIQTNARLPAIRIRTSGVGERECYTVTVGECGAEIVGTDPLGTVYGIYAFSEKCLDVLPVHRLVDRFPKARDSMEIAACTFASEPHKVRFRGWFLNDEDLLTELKISGGRRRIDYPFYENVMDPSVLDMILETALRMEINLIIPSSFIDIDNPAEEKLVECVCRRGLYISQHHVEPVGVSYFAVDNYVKDRGHENESVSFIQNRARMEEVWRYYIKKWAKYGDHVIWQLGLRGKADNSVWKTDPTVPNGDAQRGAIITDAIATQHKIITETLGTSDFLSTSTLWHEGSELYRGGHLRLPAKTIAIFSDIGYNQMFGNDFYNTQRKPGDRYGIYYHVGFWVQGPHLAEGTDLQKMVFSYREAAKNHSLYYSIVNVSNVRPLHFSAWLCSKLLRDPANADARILADDLIRKLYGCDADAVSKLLWEYYATIGDCGKDEIKYICKRAGFDYHDLGEMPFPERPLTDGALRYIIQRTLDQKDFYYTENTELYKKVLTENLKKWESLLKRAESIVLCDENKLYFAQFLQFEIFYMLQMTRAALACRSFIDAKSEKDLTDAYNEAIEALSLIVEKRRILELGEWKHWHRGEKKIGVLRWISELERLYPIRKENLK